MFKKIIILIVVFSLLGMVYGETINIGDLEVKNSSPSDNLTFKLNLNGNKYMLKFTHYGNINWTITPSITLYLNNHDISTFDKNNSGLGWNKKSKSIVVDKSNFNIGNNTLKLESNGPIKKYTYYKLKDIILIVNNTNTSTNSTSSNTSTAKAPIPTPAIVIGVLTMIFIMFKYKYKNEL
ncbi:hypothetical protein [Methanothermococcus okinawensis]|uniref:Uncharacterized protein n=1 Tax=Methanothermococcus okinawensis (strain DSM 14208 / JCM 11175 / IH1) TaxID=647113 RepID=F8AMD4_METOI|nr:hypothetical protein [Methanothermococcus okinawensis]AEH06826.1 hypothetical protein Metok_0853 [Methanothermococcus okinawensis IH1]